MKTTPEYFTTWYSFCPNCQTKLTTKQTKIDCPDCDFALHYNPVPTTSIVLHQNEKVLLVKRGIDPHKNTWDLPGGFLDLEETAETGASRELDEELTITIPPEAFRYLGSYVDIYGDTKTPLVNLGFAAKLPQDAELQAQDDVADFKWFAAENIPWDEIAFAGVKKTLADFLDSI